MNIFAYFTQRSDHRYAPAPDIAQLERDIEDRMALRKAARAEPNSAKRGWIIRQINREAGGRA